MRPPVPEINVKRLIDERDRHADNQLAAAVSALTNHHFANTAYSLKNQRDRIPNRGPLRQRATAVPELSPPDAGRLLA